MDCRCTRKRFCNEELFEETKRRDAHCEDKHREHCKGCEFEAKCRCDGKHICVKLNPQKCCLNLEVEKKHKECNKKED